MMYLKGIYDSGTNRLMIEFRFSLIENYWEMLKEFIGVASKDGIIPKGSEVKKIEGSPDKCLILIPVKLKGAERLSDGERMTNLPPEVTTNLALTLEAFKNGAYLEEFKSIEFIPLKGYPMDKLQKDIDSAIDGKRDFCLVDSYSNYRKFNKRETEKIKQKRLKYMTKEYADVALMIHKGDTKRLKELESELVETSWE